MATCLFIPLLLTAISDTFAFVIVWLYRKIVTKKCLFLIQDQSTIMYKSFFYLLSVKVLLLRRENVTTFKITWNWCNMHKSNLPIKQYTNAPGRACQ